MSQEITIIVMVDVEAAIKANQLDGNIYLIDNLRTDGSIGEGTEQLNTVVNGSYWSDGSQASEVIVNWLTGSLGSLPPTLPRNFHVERTKDINEKLLNSIKAIPANKTAKANVPELLSTVNRLTKPTLLRDNNGNKRELGIKSLTVTGEHFEKGSNHPSEQSYLAPVITNITGEAVDKGVLFVCQLGTPVYIKNGWYWCATADTSKVGEYSYTMHITLYHLVNNVYEPIQMTHDAKIKVSSSPQRNGFTGAGMWSIPLPI